MKLAVLLAATPLLLLSACAETSTRPPAAVASAARAEVPQPSAEVRGAQERLHTMGLYSGPIDGLWGPATEAAVQAFQHQRGMAVTARLDDSTLRALESATTVVRLSDPTDVRTVQNRLRQLNFYNGPADGVWGPGTQAAIESLQRARNLPVGEITGATLTAMGLDPASFPTRTAGIGAADRGPLSPPVVANVQRQLRERGYYTGGVDGVWGPATQAAIQRFQQSRGLVPTGDLNPTTATMLGLNPNNLSASLPPQ